MGQGLSLSRSSDDATSEWVDDNRNSDLVAPLLPTGPVGEPRSHLDHLDQSALAATDASSTVVDWNHKDDEELAQRTSNCCVPTLSPDSLQQQPQQQQHGAVASDRTNDDGNDQEEHGDATPSDQITGYEFMLMPLIPWKSLSVGGVKIIEGARGFNFLKFSILSVLLIVTVHTLVRLLDWEHDSLNTLEAILVYQSNLLWLDLAVFFVVGRYPIVDTVSWVLIATTSGVFTSWITRFPFLQHSATLFEMHCTWSWMTWVYAMLVALLIVIMVVLHVRYSIRHSQLVTKSVEVAATALAIFGPSLLLSPSDFHLHHWLVGWWLGMHCNFPTVYSNLCMAWCWGIYVNGIAVYGRDPMQMCGYIDYYYHDQHCHGESNAVSTRHNDDTPADWRNCSASGYHP